jgi:hypothetical protein
MSFAEKIAHTAETLTGSVKKLVGRLAGSLHLRKDAGH